MGRLLLIVLVSLFLKVGACLGDPIDPIIDQIFEKLSKQEIVNTFKTDKELLFTLLNNTKPLYKKLIEKPDAERKIARIFSMLCALTIPDFQISFPAGQRFCLTQNQIWDYWMKIMTQVITYYHDLNCSINDYLSSENSESENVLDSENLEKDDFEETDLN